jgi:hypothetical protein
MICLGIPYEFSFVGKPSAPLDNKDFPVSEGFRKPRIIPNGKYSVDSAKYTLMYLNKTTMTVSLRKRYEKEGLVW